MIRQHQLMAAGLCALFIAPLFSSADTPLPRDPKNVYGIFDNGMEYIVRQHDNPPGRIEINLHVQTGALNETSKQNGLAHFLEHMGFNGTTHFAPGTLIPHLSDMGMTFGAHSNAHTNYYETVYKLSMPNTEDKTIDTALTVFADFANGMLLLQEEVDKERGIILEESRSRKSARERIQKQFMQNVFKDTRLAEHDIIGKEDQIEKFPKSEFDDYWNTWYRPEAMTLIVVGDIDPAKMIEKARTHLGSFTARAPARKYEGGGVKAVNATRAFAFTDPELPGCQVQMMRIEAARKPVSTYEQYRSRTIERIATAIVNRRLQDKVQRGEADFFGGSCFVQSLFNEATMAGGGVSGLPEKWNGMLEQLIVEISRAVDHGFSQQEIDIIKDEMISRSEVAVEREPTADARRFVGRYARAVGMDNPIMSAEQRLELTRKIFTELSPSEVHAAFVHHYETRHFTYVLNMPEKEGVAVPSSKDILAAASAGWGRKTQPLESANAIDQLLATLPAPGKVVNQSTDPDLKITTATLDNGAIVHHRFMDYKKDEASISINFAGGIIEETAANRGVSQVAGLVNATSRYSSTQIRDFMAGKKAGAGGGVGFDLGTMRVSGSPADLEVGMQLAYALMTDGKIEQASFDVWKDASLQALEQRGKTARDQLSMAMERTFYGNDIRYVDLTAEQIKALTPAQGEKWFERMINSAAIEVTVVGDIKLDRAMELVTRYVGSLPKRSMGAAEAIEPLRKLERSPGPYNETVKFDSLTPKAMATAGYIGASHKDIRDNRILALGCRILSERMIKRIREEEGIVYGIGCSHRPATAMPGTGLLSAGSTTDPADAEKLATIVVGMLQEFAANGPTAEEVVVAKKQMKNNLDKQMLEPRYWQGQLSSMHYRGRTLEQLKEMPAVLETFTRDDIQNVFKKYVKPERLVRYVIVPNVTETTEPADEKEAVPAGH